LGDFKVGFSVGVYCTNCTLNSGVNTNFEITHCLPVNQKRYKLMDNNPEIAIVVLHQRKNPQIATTK
jgi:hypothetical protein